jgi:hypothetical protein
MDTSDGVSLNNVTTGWPRDPWYAEIVMRIIRKFCKHRIIVSVIGRDAKDQLHHHYDYCERCGQSWWRYGS